MLMKIEKIIIDTNILLYSIQETNKYYQYSIDIIKNNLDSIILTSKNISEFTTVLTKQNIDYKIILDHLKRLTDRFKILYPDDKSQKIFYELLEKYNPKGNRVFDIEIVSIMLSNGITKIATVNKSDFETITEIEVI